MARPVADRVVVARAPSAYGCCPTDALLWTMVQPFTGRRVGAVARRRLHPSTIPMCAKMSGRSCGEPEPDATPAPSGTATAGRMTTVESDEGVSTDGLGHALRRMRDPVLLLLLPLGFAALDLAYGHGSVDVGFDFRGTLWEPARALLDGVPMYPEPTRAAVEIGNPAVYPPFAILLTAPLALLSAAAASWVWFVGARRGRAGLDVDRRRARLALPRAGAHLAGRAPGALLGQPHAGAAPARSHWRGAIASGRRSWESRSGRPSRQS